MGCVGAVLCWGCGANWVLDVDVWGRHALLAAVDEAIRLGLTEEAQTGQARLRKMAYQ